MTPQPTQDSPAQAAIADAKKLIANLELPYLEELQNELAKHIERRRAAARSAAAEEILRIAKSVGLSPEEIIRAAPVKLTKAKQPGKYRDPATGAEWSGSGRRPAWVIAHLEGGGTLADLAISKL